MQTAARKRSTRKTALESGKAPFPGRFPERWTEESNLALRFWRPAREGASTNRYGVSKSVGIGLGIEQHHEQLKDRDFR